MADAVSFLLERLSMSGPGRRRNLGLEGRGLPREGQEPPGLAVGGPGAAACSVLAVGGRLAAAALRSLSVASGTPLDGCAEPTLPVPSWCRCSHRVISASR